MIESHQFESLCRILNGHGLICYKNCFDVGWEKTENYDRRAVKKWVQRFQLITITSLLHIAFIRKTTTAKDSVTRLGYFCRSL